MQNKDELIRENEALRRRIQTAEIWMERQIHESLRSIQYDRNKRSSRSKFENLLEIDIVENLSDRIEKYFGKSLFEAPLYTAERLMDSEIYWMTLQKHPTIDAFPIIASYQKILDAYFEERFTLPFRQASAGKSFIPTREKGLESDIENVIQRGYSLSLGRWYQFFSGLREHTLSGSLSRNLHEFLETEHSGELALFLDDTVFDQFQTLINMEVFSRKRHYMKISFIDAKKTRVLLVGNYQQEGLLKYIFNTIE